MHKYWLLFLVLSMIISLYGIYVGEMEGWNASRLILAVGGAAMTIYWVWSVINDRT